MKAVHVHEWHRPSTLAEACAMLRRGGTMPIAGGTDVMVRLRRGAFRDVSLVAMKGIPGLATITGLSGGLLIGSGATLSAVAADARVAKNYAALAQGALLVGTPQIRNLGTIGGNVCNASPCADTAPGLLVSDAAVVITDGENERELPIARFWKGPGKTALAPGELVTGFFLPPPKPGMRQGFRKLGPRRAADIAVVNLGISLVLDEGIISDARIALGSVAPVPLRAATAEGLLRGISRDTVNPAEVAAAALADVSPISDLRGSAWYRNKAVGALVEELLMNILGGKGRQEP